MSKVNETPAAPLADGPVAAIRAAAAPSAPVSDLASVSDPASAPDNLAADKNAGPMQNASAEKTAAEKTAAVKTAPARSAAKAAPSSKTSAAAPAIAPAAASSLHVDESRVAVCYANFCRVTGTPEELILDCGLNTQPFDNSAPVQISQRVVLNYFTAKRLLGALQLSVQRHEQAFGVLETNVQKRVVRRGG